MPEKDDKDPKGEGEDPKQDQGQDDGGQGEKPIADFEAWLKEQEPAVQAAFAGHVGGLKSALEKEREARATLEKAQKAQAKDKAKAEEERLKESEEWEKLAEKRLAEIEGLEARVAELEPLQESLERYKEALAGYVKRAREGLPDHLVPLLDQMDEVDQLAYLTKHSDVLKTAPMGVPATPKARGDGKVTEEERRKQSAGIRGYW